MFKKNFSRYKKLAFNPKEFFRSINSEDVIPAIKFYLYVIITFSIIIIIASFFTLNFNFSAIIRNIISSVSNIIISFLTILIFSALVYVGVLIYNKGKADFSSVFKILLYSLTITLFYSTLAIIISSLFEIYHPINQLITQISQTQNPATIFQEIIKDKIHLSRILITTILSIISLIHFLSLATIGIAESHKIKKWKAFMSIITIPLILLILVIIAIITAFSSQIV